MILVNIEFECTYSISHEQTTFAHSTVPDQQHFEEVITKEQSKLVNPNSQIN
jgi:hypothetical protein